jgi:O-antigen ligase
MQSPAALRTFLTVLLLLAIVVIECAVGGTKLVFSIPSYCLLGLAAFASAFHRRPVDSRPSLVCLAVTAVYFGYILFRASRSPVEYFWWTDYFMVLGCLAVYYLTAVHLTGIRERRAVLWTLFVLAAVEVFIGLRQFAVGDNWMPFGFIRADSGRRASGMLISSIHLAGLLEAIAPFALAFALWGKWKNWQRILAGYVALLCYVGIAVTGSRGGYLSALFSLLVFVAISLHARRKTRPERFKRTAVLTVVGIVASVSVAVLLMNQSTLLRKRLSMIPQQLEKNGLDIRIYNWQATLDQFRQEPLFGTGAGTHLFWGRHFRRPPLQADPIHAHSDYLELLAEYGIIGAAGMAIFLAVHLGYGWRNYRTVLRTELSGVAEYEPARHDSLALYIGALAAVASYLAHSAVDFNLHIPGHALIFAFIFGVLASPVYGAPGGKMNLGFFVFRWALPVLGLFIIVSAFPKFAGEYLAEKARVAFRNGQALGLIGLREGAQKEFDRSIEFAKDAIEYQELNPELFFAYGGALRGAGLVSQDRKVRVANLEAAVEAYMRALKLFPQDHFTIIRLAETLTELGRFKEAEELFRVAIVLDKNLGRSHAYYAYYLATVGREEEAEQSLLRARELAHGDNVDSVVEGTPLDPTAYPP